MSKKLLCRLALAAVMVSVSTPDGARLEAQAGTSVVISELRTRGPQGGNDEFVELFNPTAAPVDIGGWKIRASNAAGTIGDRAILPAATNLGPGCYFLATNTAASGYSGSVAGDVTYTTGITDDGGVALTRSDDSVVDQVGMSSGSAFGEGMRLDSFGGANGDRAYARTPTAGSDSDDNAADFLLSAPSGPQNSAAVSGCSGPPGDQNDTVISQVHGGGGNSGSVFTNDFIEIFNPGPDPVDLGGWSVQYGSGGGSTWSVTALSGTVGPGGYHLVQQSGGASGTTALPAPDSVGTIAMSATDGKVALVRSLVPLAGACPVGGDRVDLVGYGDANCFEGGSPAPGLGANRSAARGHAGCIDTDVNGADFAAMTPLPRNSASALNSCAPPPVEWPHIIQGSGSASSLVGQTVAVHGIVTAKRFNNGFFVQTPDAIAAIEGDPMTSEGLFVFTSIAPSAVSVGDEVIVTGTVAEFSPSTDPSQPPVTEIVSPVVAVLATGQPLPDVTTLTATDLNPAGGPLQLERYEGMRVAAAGLLTVVSPTNGNVNETNATGSNIGAFHTVLAGTPRPYREPGIDIIDAAPACDENAMSPCAIPVFDGNPERLRVDSDGQVGVFPGAIVSTGATVSIASGVLDYAFRTWTILPDASALAIVSDGQAVRAVPAPDAQEYRVASFNLQRFFDAGDDPGISEPVLTPTAYGNRLAKASLIVRDFLHTPDILGVQEAESFTVVQDLAARIDADATAAGQTPPAYQAYLEEGNDIGGIDVGFLVRANVTMHSVTQWRKDETYINPNNGRDETLNDRPSLVLDATVQGPSDRRPAHVVVVVNHLRSLIDIDHPTDGDRVRAKRKAQAESVAQLLIELQAQYPGVPVVSVGDYNAFDVSDGYVDVLGIIRGDQAPPEQVVDWSSLGLDPNFIGAASPGDYSYVFDGNAQTLDHILLSPAAAAARSGFEQAHIDADFPEVWRGDAMRPERLSDHDPAVASFMFPADTIDPVGAMRGHGRVNGRPRTTFTFFVRQAPTGPERGWLQLTATRRRGLPNTFVGNVQAIRLRAMTRLRRRFQTGWTHFPVHREVTPVYFYSDG